MGSEIDPVTVETATRKRPLEPPPALVKLEVSPKRPCAGTDTDGDSFEEFFALLKRIEATDRHCFRSRGANRQEPAAKSIEAGKIDDACKAVTTHASWWPSFEWEDFSSRGNGTRNVDPKAIDRNFKAARKREQVSPVANLDGERSLDLNLPLELMPL